MGRRCREAAWGATFALFVAACAATEVPPEQRSSSARVTESVVPTAPVSIADAGFIEPAPTAGLCVGGDESKLALLDPATGARLWEFATPRPSGATVVEGSAAFVGFAWSRDLHPGVLAVDLGERMPKWQRFLEQQPTQMRMVDDHLIVVTSRSVRALSAESGDDLWVVGPDADLIDVAVNVDSAFLLSISGVTSIDLRTGKTLWEYPRVRPDAIAASDSVVAIAVGTKIIAIDLAARAALWERDVERRGADQIWVGNDGTVVAELAPSADPAGALVGLDRSTGLESWRVSGAGEAIWPDASTVLTTTIVADQGAPEPYDLLAIDATTGEVRWSLASAFASDLAVIGTGDSRAIVSLPHPNRPESQRLQLLDTTTGLVMVEASTSEAFDGASVVGSTFMAVHRTFDRLDGDRGYAGLILGPGRSWATPFADGVEQPPHLTPYGVLAVAGELHERCIARRLAEPRSAVLSASVTTSQDPQGLG